MPESTDIPKGLPAGVPLVRVADEAGRLSFVPLQGVVDQFGIVTAFQTLRQPTRGDEPENTSPVTGTNLLTDRSGSLQSFGLMVASTPYTPDPVQADLFLRTTGGRVFGGGSGASESVTLRQGGDVRAFLYGFNATGSDARPVRVNDNNELVVSQGAVPTLELVTADDEPTNDTTNTSIAAANANRRQIIIQNVDATDAVRIGDTNITTTRGIRLAAGESVTLGAADLRITEQIFARAEANTPSVAVTEIQAV